MRSSLDEVFVALGDPTRIAVVDLLRRQPLRSGELAAELELARPAMSRHLAILRKAGLVAETTLTDDARGRRYELRPERFAECRSWLETVEQFWRTQLASFKAHAERKRGPGRR